MTTTGKTTNPAADVKVTEAGAAPSTPKPSPAPAAKVALKASKAPSAKPSSAVLKTVVKAPAKEPAKSPVKPAVKAKPKAPTSATAKSLPMAKAKADKPAKEKKPKLVRDSFTIPKGEYATLDELKQRAGKLAVQVKKSELLRAGIKALAGMPDATFLTTLKLVPIIKTGRPGKD
jgi:hypothetical protein